MASALRQRCQNCMGRRDLKVMPKEMISPNWRASERTIKSLVNAGYTDEQRKRILIKFIKQHGGTEVESASTLYNKWVRFENAHGIKPNLTVGEALDKKRADDITNRSKDAEERAVEAKKVSGDTTQDYARAWIDKQRGLTGE